MALNQMEITVLKDGTVRIVTGKFDGAVHMTAEAFDAFVRRELGGDVQIFKGHTHTHGSEHDHEHVGGKK